MSDYTCPHGVYYAWSCDKCDAELAAQSKLADVAIDQDKKIKAQAEYIGLLEIALKEAQSRAKELEEHVKELEIVVARTEEYWN